MADEHTDFWSYISEKDREHDLVRWKKRRKEQHERDREEEILARKEELQKPALYGDVTSDRFKFGLGDDQEPLVGADNLTNENNIFSKDKISGNDFMESYLYQSDARDDTMRPLLGPKKTKRTAKDKKDDADSEADPRTMEWAHVLKMDYALGDWAPAPVDLLTNGGFTQPVFNGRPVPYRLNGHININRKLPWDTAD
ncbi:MAG TPA: hypothetical protein V6C86_27320 [Oculatellaceae cyanobacterium]